MHTINVSNIEISNAAPFTLIGGVNVIESREMVLRAAEAYVKHTTKLNIPYIFKASFDKANRSSIDSFRGPGLQEGLKILEEVKTTFNVPLITDVHEINQADAVAEVCDVLQVPAFLARQTDLIQAIAKTGKPVNVKKPQFISPQQIKNIVNKVHAFGNQQVMVCERGTNFGYDNLVVDMLGFDVIKEENNNIPLVFDVTHALQQRAPGEKASGGRGKQVYSLARAGLATGVAALFLEAHENPAQAKCDGPSALPLDQLPQFLQQAKMVDDTVKAFI